MHNIFRLGSVAGLLLLSATAFADDPTGVLLRERGQSPRQDGGAAQFSDVGPCGPGTQSESFPNAQGFRCIPQRN
jgi:hypothetical protein